MNTLIWDVRYIHVTNLISDYIFITVKILNVYGNEKNVCHLPFHLPSVRRYIFRKNCPLKNVCLYYVILQMSINVINYYCLDCTIDLLFAFRWAD